MANITITKELLERFNVAGPRYTSYPTAPEWTDPVSEVDFYDRLQSFSRNDKALSLYLHIPFCHSLCTYCGCTTTIRKNLPKYADQYLAYLERELQLVIDKIGRNKRVVQFHIGGGTPTFLNNDQLSRILLLINGRFDLDYNGEFAIEIDPRTIDHSKLKLLKQLGFNRISFGVQDFDPEVQRTINRVQSYDLVADLFIFARKLGFSSINFDLIYGLPKQTVDSFAATIEKVIALQPDRIACYSYAYVPWMKHHQARIAEFIPSTGEKIDIFLNARRQLVEQGDYIAVAMDHFARPNDSMAQAFMNGTLHRNFMGYTLRPADDFLGIGMSSISFIEKAFFQNEDRLADYYALIDNNHYPIRRGKLLSQDDIIRQWTIHALICRFHLDKNTFQQHFALEFDEYFNQEQEHIAHCALDGLLIDDDKILKVTDLGKIFVRNICMGFDWYLRRRDGHRRFSQTV